jgi:hypothetical protein
MTQGEALSILKTGANVFLTGSPGSGKTHTINEYVAWLRSTGIEPSVTAATGIAATHVSGMTLHSWSGIGIAEHLSEADVDRIAGKEHVARRIQKSKVLIIDEISMLSANTFSMADRVCREVRRTTLPFGGIQVVMVGDFFQLPPVSRGGQETLFAYAGSAWRELNPLMCYLTEQYRQDDDEFLAVLAAIRRNEVDEMHFEHLTGRIVAIGDAPEDAPKLFSHNADVDRINAAELAKLPGEKKSYRMNGKGSAVLIEGLKRGCLSPETLDLKKNAVVMFTKNSPLGTFVNGTLGVVTGFSANDSLPIVETKDGRTITAEPMEWQVEEQGKVRASVSQVPLRLAWAMTVHKSQGMSMDAAVIDLSQAFEYGQGYVALSRVRRLSGVHLLGMNARALEVHPDIVEKDTDFREASGAAGSTFAAMDDAELETMQKRFVKALGGAWPRERVAGDATNEKAMRGVPGRLAATLGIVRDAKNLKEAARSRSLTASTIVKHLEDLHKLGKLMREDIAHLMPSGDALAQITDAFTAVETDRLAPVYAALDGAYSFEEIRLARLLSKDTI